MNKLVSIILPCYNGEKFLSQAIESIINQTYQTWELIIINDCSTDNTLKIAKSFADKDKRIHVYTNEVNSKLPKSLNIGFSYAKGDYFTWTSDDNYYRPTAFEEMVAFLEKEQEAVMVCCDYEIIDDNDELIENVTVKPQPEIMLAYNACGACFLYRKKSAEQVGNYEEQKFLVEDYNYWLRMGLIGEILPLHKNLYVYRKHRQSLTSTRNQEIVKLALEQSFLYLEKYLEKYPYLKEKSEIQKFIIYKAVCGLEHNPHKDYMKKLAAMADAKTLYKLYKKAYKQKKNGVYIEAMSNLGLLYKIKSVLFKNKQKTVYSCLDKYRLALTWITNYTIDYNGIVVNSLEQRIYPEVTGYYIPTLLRWGLKEQALKFVNYLLTIQNDDGSWNEPSGTYKYTFDTGQILKGLYEFVDEGDKYKQAFLKGCDYIVAQQRENGSIATDNYSWWGLPYNKIVPESIHLYCLEPLRKASKKFGIQKYEDCVQKALNFYLADEKLTDFETLSHFNAYIIEALIDLNCFDRAKKAMDNIATYQAKNGSVPAYSHVNFVCSTGLFQYAICWYKLGELEKANNAFEYALNLQNPSGGWYGSYGKKANYFPDAEISWAVKYFLDALFYKLKLEFEQMYQIFPNEIDKTDGRYIEVKKYAEQAQLILDAGCGKGRFDKNLIEDFPRGKEFHGMDISHNILGLTPEKLITKQGTLLNAPYKNESFDLVYCVEALEHAVNIEAAVKELSRLVKKGGKLLIIDKNLKKLGKMKIEDWEQWFDIAYLTQLMQKNGFVVTVTENIPYEKEQFNDELFVSWCGVKE